MSKLKCFQQWVLGGGKVKAIERARGWKAFWEERVEEKLVSFGNWEKEERQKFSWKRPDL